MNNVASLTEELGDNFKSPENRVRSAVAGGGFSKKYPKDKKDLQKSVKWRTLIIAMAFCES